MRDMGVMTHSRSAAFRSCPWREFVRYELGLRPSGHDAASLSFGRLWHRSMQELYCDLLVGNAMEAAEARAVDWLTCTDDVSDERRDLALAMLAMYVAHWGELDNEALDVLMVEQAFRVPLKAYRDPSTKWAHEGVIDLVVRDLRDDLVWVYDHKSTVGVDAMADEVRVDGQGLGYCSALLGLGLPLEQLGGVVYRITRKKAPSTPKVNKNGSLSTQKCDTHPDVYAAAMDAAAYQGHLPTDKHRAILSSLQAKWPKGWMDEVRVRATPERIHSWRREMHQVTLAKNAAQHNGEAGHWRAGSAGACTRWGRLCEYADLCQWYAEDSKALWEHDFALQHAYERVDAHEELPGEDETITGFNFQQLPLAGGGR